MHIARDSAVAITFAAPTAQKSSVGGVSIVFITSRVVDRRHATELLEHIDALIIEEVQQSLPNDVHIHCRRYLGAPLALRCEVVVATSHITAESILFPKIVGS